MNNDISYLIDRFFNQPWIRDIPYPFWLKPFDVNEIFLIQIHIIHNIPQFYILQQLLFSVLAIVCVQCARCCE